MGHQLMCFRPAVLRGLARSMPGLRLLELPQELALGPMPYALIEAVGEGRGGAPGPETRRADAR
jgi:hypothetical protein